MLKESVEDSKDLADKEGVEVELKTREEDIFVFGGLSLRKVFSTLLKNSIRKSSCSKLRIYTEELDGKVVARIEDHGGKLPEKIKKKFSEKV